MENRLTVYDETQHKYFIDNVEVPSVTQLVAPLGKDYDEPDDYFETVLDIAAERGITMHAYIEHRLNGGSREEFELPDMYDIYAEAVESFLTEHEITPLLIETHLYGTDYAGTPDLVCEFDGAMAILDYKFVSTVAKSKVGGQLVGYRKLCELNGIYVDELYAVHFKSNGTYALLKVNEEPIEPMFETCLQIYKHKNYKHKRGAIG